MQKCYDLIVIYAGNASWLPEEVDKYWWHHLLFQLHFLFFQVHYKSVSCQKKQTLIWERRWKPNLNSSTCHLGMYFFLFNNTPSHKPQHSFLFLRGAALAAASISGSDGGRKGNQTLAELSQQKTHSCENNSVIIKQNKKCPETTFLVNPVIKQLL